MAKLKTVKGTFSLFSYVGDVQGCGTIRVIWPHFLLNHLRMKNMKFSAFFTPFFVHHPDFYKNYGICQFQRSATETHLQIFQHFKKVIKPQSKCGLVYESDDLLVDIPKWNYAHDYYKKYFPHIKKMMSIADGMTVSTLRLKKIYSEYNENIVVIPNHLPKHVWGHIYPKHENEPRDIKPRILWAGSQNHFVRKIDSVQRGMTGGDFGDKLMSFIRKTTDKYQWVFVGAMPVELESVKNKIEFHQWQPVFEYPQYVKNLDVDFGIAPLEDNVFNACKSNIKMLEYTACGVPGVYSNVEPYWDAHLKADNEDEMIAHIEALGDNINLRATAWRKDYQKVRGLLWWEESGNLKHYANSYLKLFGRRLP